MDPDHDRLTAAAIARRAGVGRAAVTNWRRRYPDFPQPVDGGRSSPLFSWGEVLRWLTATGKADQLATAGRTDTGTQRIDDVAPPEIGGRVVVPRDRTAADLTPSQLLGRVMAALLPFPEDLGDRFDPDDADVGEPPTVLDPACSDGARLLAVADRFGDHVTLIGHETDESAATLAAESLRHHAFAPPYAVHAGDSVLDTNLGRYVGAAAAVVCQPPAETRQWPTAATTADPRWQFGVPGSGDPDLTWVQHCLAHLRPGGSAVVAVSPLAGVRPSAREFRSGLVRSGTLREVIALPRGLGAAPDTDVHLWVLQRPYLEIDPAPVRMVDLSGLADPADVPDDASAWELLHVTSDSRVVRAVPRLELLDGGTDLLPSRHVVQERGGLAGELAGVTDRLRELYVRVGRAFPEPSEALLRRDRPVVTLAELERAGALKIRPRDTTPRAGDVLLRTLGRSPVVATGALTDDDGVAQVVEIDPSFMDAHFVAMSVRADTASLPTSNTHGALSREDLRRCRIPRLSIAEQRRYGLAFRHVLDLQDALAALNATSASVLDQIIHGMTTGALLPNPPSARGTIATDPNESEIQ